MHSHRYQAAHQEAQRRLRDLVRRETSFANSCPEWCEWIVENLAEALFNSPRFQPERQVAA